MKFAPYYGIDFLLGSLPILGAWIEISDDAPVVKSVVASLPILGAWIEILAAFISILVDVVAPYTGSVD